MSLKQTIMRFLRSWYLQESGKERISPNDWIRRDQIKYDPITRTVSIGGLEPEVKVFGVADTGSMDGLVDFGHSVILTDNFDKDKLAIGDIIAYYQISLNLTLHRIVEMGLDSQGKWYHTRGDNCIDNDGYRLRKEHIKYLLLGIIY